MYTNFKYENSKRSNLNIVKMLYQIRNKFNIYYYTYC